ncbi:hypothetical protein SLS62_000851 [Diatrype stigma]|uniref:Uncharacterized protein n=1 Tax=Diatrype stigma TaxID=117547 RepID=A0AAN9V0K3_9PEZI
MPGGVDKSISWVDKLIDDHLEHNSQRIDESTPKSEDTQDRKKKEKSNRQTTDMMSNQDIYQTLQVLVDAEALNTSSQGAVQKGEEMQSLQGADESVGTNEHVQAEASEQACDTEDLPGLSDCDQDELVNLLECEYCGASLLPPSNPNGQPLEFCGSDKCGMPSGIPTFKDWSGFCDEA